MRCYIFASAEIQSYEWLKNIDFDDSFIICADGGLKHIKKLGLKANVWIGDGDSLKEDEPLAEEVITFPPQKDNTDTDLAVEFALKNGYKEIIIIGGIGGRIDHEFSHFCLLRKILERGASGFLVDEKNIITMRDRTFEIKDNGKKYVSFFPFGEDVIDFSVKGLKYECEGIALSSKEAKASSNSFKNGETATISFDKGCVLVIYSDD